MRGSFELSMEWILGLEFSFPEKLQSIVELILRGFTLVIIPALRGGVILLAHDACRKLKADTYIGDNCFVGCRSIILPGVKIGNEVVIGAGSVVTKDIPDKSIAAGNPAKVIKTGIYCEKWGRIINSRKRAT